MYPSSLSDTLRSLASKLDGVQTILNGGNTLDYTAGMNGMAGMAGMAGMSGMSGMSGMRSLNTTVPNVGQGTQMILLEKLDTLSKQLEEVNRNIMGLRNHTPQAASILPLNPMHGIEVVPKREVVIPEANSLSLADRLLLNKDAKKALEAEEMGASRNNEYPLEEEEEDEEEAYESHGKNPYSNASTMDVEETGDMEEEEEEEDEAEEKEEEEEAEKEEAEDSEEEEEEVLEEFEYKGSTYYRDSQNNVFMTDEDDNLLEEPIGTWNPDKKSIMKKP
jgi:hypothetical protein